jgi:hypothetical protein
MSEKSVSQIANERREEDHEANRKSVSPSKGKTTQNPNTNCGRDEQRETSVKGQNLGSNKNNPDRVVSNRERVGHLEVEAHGVAKPGTTVEQFVRKHEPAPVVADGTTDNRKAATSTVTLGRHVQSDEGFKIVERRSASVAQNRKETEKVFADRRKKSSVNR